MKNSYMIRYNKYYIEIIILLAAILVSILNITSGDLEVARVILVLMLGFGIFMYYKKITEPSNIRYIKYEESTISKKEYDKYVKPN